MKVIWETFRKHDRIWWKYRISCIIAGFVSCRSRMCKYLHLFHRNFFFLNCLIDFWHIFKDFIDTRRGIKRSTLTCVMLLSFRQLNGASCWALIMEFYAFQLARFLRSRSHFVRREVKGGTKGSKTMLCGIIYIEKGFLQQISHKEGSKALACGEVIIITEMGH